MSSSCLSNNIVVFIIILYSIIESNRGNEIDTTAPNEYENGEIHCNQNENCTVICDEDASCRNTDIYCPSNANYQCDVECIGDNYNCYQAFIDCSNTQKCVVQCDGLNACEHAEIKWPNNNRGTLLCNGQNSCSYTNFPVPPPNENYELNTCDTMEECRYSTIPCPLNADCNIICGALRSCHEATIIWSLNNTSINSVLSTPTEPCIYCTKPPIYPINDNTDLYLTCDEKTCHEAVIYCPKYAECHIICNGSFSCYWTTFIWPETSLYSLNCVDSSSCQGIRYKPYDDNQPLTLDNVQGQSQIINCPANKPCNLNCNGFVSCTQSVVNCPSNSQCNIICNGYWSCQASIFIGIGTISCSGQSSCHTTQFPEPPSNTDYTLTCIDYFSCAYSTIRCPQNADCIIHCTGQESCRDSNIIWSTNTALNSTLICGPGTDACLNVNVPPIIYQQSKNDITDLYVQCSANSQCANSIIDCPSSAICDIICSGVDSCKNTIFNGGNDKLTIMCSGNSSCYNTEIYAQTVSSLTIGNCTEIDSCRYMTVWFPTYDDINKNPRAIIDGITDIGFTDVLFYAINGWKDIVIANYNYNAHGIMDHIGKMFCGTNDYEMFCYFATNGWQCHPYGDIRCDYTPSLPTTAPTAVTPSPSATTSGPTPAPTTNPTAVTASPSATTGEPTTAPTYQPTNNTPLPTETTSNPTPSPTNNPTPSPTDNPTPSPTDAPIASGDPTKSPTKSTVLPTPSPTNQPTPSTAPTKTGATRGPTSVPSAAPTKPPTKAPTKPPTKAPTKNPTSVPSSSPSATVVSATDSIDPTNTPTRAPVATLVDKACQYKVIATLYAILSFYVFCL